MSGRHDVNPCQTCNIFRSLTLLNHVVKELLDLMCSVSPVWPSHFPLCTVSLGESAVGVSEPAPVCDICRATTISISMKVLNGSRQVSLNASSSCMSVGWLGSTASMPASTSNMANLIDAELQVFIQDHKFVFNSSNIIVFHDMFSLYMVVLSHIC